MQTHQVLPNANKNQLCGGKLIEMLLIAREKIDKINVENIPFGSLALNV